MERNKINGVDFIDRIEGLEEGYKRYIETSNFFSDYPNEIRHALNGISPNSFFGVKKMIKESEKNLLIESYTISEQMLKNTKYQLLNFDETSDEPYQNFLKYKLEPTRFSPNPKTDEINKIFSRYRGRKLMLTYLPIYDKMITERHRYAHIGAYNFKIGDLPKIIGTLKYLEFEYRMFLGKTEWCEFIKKVTKCKKIKYEDQSLLREIGFLSSKAKHLFEESVAFRTFENRGASCDRERVLEFIFEVKNAKNLSDIRKYCENLRIKFRDEYM